MTVPVDTEDVGRGDRTRLYGSATAVEAAKTGIERIATSRMTESNRLIATPLAGVSIPITLSKPKSP
jgi:hypothetical protein